MAMSAGRTASRRHAEQRSRAAQNLPRARSRRSRGRCRRAAAFRRWSGRDAARDRPPQPARAHPALDSLPKQCRADFEKFLASGEAKSKANAAQAAASYAQLDKNPQCRDAIKRIAAALNVGLPHRKIAAGDRGDWNAALAGPQRASIDDIPDIDVSNIPDTGFDPGDSLDSAIDMLNALSGGLGALPARCARCRAIARRPPIAPPPLARPARPRCNITRRRRFSLAPAPTSAARNDRVVAGDDSRQLKPQDAAERPDAAHMPLSAFAWVRQPSIQVPR